MTRASFLVCLSFLAIVPACKKEVPAKSMPMPASPMGMGMGTGAGMGMGKGMGMGTGAGMGMGMGKGMGMGTGMGMGPSNARPMRPPAVDVADAKVLLTDDKLSRFATYQKAMLPFMGDATGMGMSAFQKGGTDQKKFQGAMAADERAAKVAAAGKAALEKSGLTQEEVSKLSRLVMSYYARNYAMQDAVKKAEEVRAKIADAKSHGKEPSPVDTAMEKMYGTQLTRLESGREDFAAQYGKDALALVKKHEPEFLVINEKIMGAAMNGMMRKP
jgi:hypothetical protein